ncbi:UNVERIFIED_CONTAM: hypothetical protein HDU68_005139 [Siphonaria sp. JEL0065]|nr:hypothetical protein HDU68_005139 [Siphonaria sp. JEL0065]
MDQHHQQHDSMGDTDTHAFFNRPSFQVVELEFPFFQPSTPNPAPTNPTNTPVSQPQVPPTVPVHTFTTHEKQFILAVEVPGFSRDQLTTSVTDDTRQIKVEGKHATRRSVELTVTVPRLGDLNQLEAVLENGILSIVIPKKERDGRLVNVTFGSGSKENASAPVDQTAADAKDSIDGYVVA